MDVSKIINFLQLLGCQKISIGSRWVRATCPMQHLHSGGKDKNPSFAVSINPGSLSHCRCQACGTYGDLISLIWRLAVDRQYYRHDLFDFLIKHNKLDVESILSESIPVETDIKSRVKASRKFTALPPRQSRFVHPNDEPQSEVEEKILVTLIESLSDNVLDYLTRKSDSKRGIEGRNLNLSTIKEWELGYHRTQGRISIPIRDENGKLVALSGRLFDPGYDSNPGPKYLHSRFKRDRILFGEHKRIASIRTGYLFEGFFQAIYSWQCGYRNVYARMGTHLSRQQAEKLVRWHDHLIIVPDGDKAGRDAAERDERTLCDLEVPKHSPPREGEPWLRIAQIDVVDMPNDKDVDMLEPYVVRALLGPLNTA